MICEKCKKDFEAGVKAAYKLGLQDGRRELQQTINLIHKTNRALYDELLRLDGENPLVNSVVLSRKEINGIVTSLRKAGKFYKARQLKKIEAQQIGRPDIPEAELRDFIDALDDSE